MFTIFTKVVRFTQHWRWTAVPVVLALAMAGSVARADTVNLTEGPPFTFETGSDLYVRFSVWNYAANNRGSSPYPTSVGLQLLGAQPSTSKLNTVPNTTNTYFSGYLLQGWLESSDGSFSTPFTSPDATRLGLAPGSLLLGPGIFGSNSTPVAIIEAEAALTTNLSEQIFGLDVASRGSSAVIHLRNLGSNLQVGLDGGYSLLSAVSEPSISGYGPVMTSGITQSMQVTAVPEPGSFLLFGAAACLFASVAGKVYFKRLRKARAKN